MTNPNLFMVRLSSKLEVCLHLSKCEALVVVLKLCLPRELFWVAVYVVDQSVHIFVPQLSQHVLHIFRSFLPRNNEVTLILPDLIDVLTESLVKFLPDKAIHFIGHLFPIW